jgi:hypothetical protein
MILIRELSTAFSVEANTVSACNSSIQFAARPGRDEQETATGRHRRNRIAKVDVCAGRRPLYAAVAWRRLGLIGKPAAGSVVRKRRGNAARKME